MNFHQIDYIIHTFLLRSAFSCSQTEFDVLWGTLHYRTKDDIISYAELVGQFLPSKKEPKDLKEQLDNNGL